MSIWIAQTQPLKFNPAIQPTLEQVNNQSNLNTLLKFKRYVTLCQYQKNYKLDIRNELLLEKVAKLCYLTDTMTADEECDSTKQNGYMLSLIHI